MSSAIGLLILILDIFAIIKIIQSSASGTEKNIVGSGRIALPSCRLNCLVFCWPRRQKSLSFYHYQSTLNEG